MKAPFRTFIMAVAVLASSLSAAPPARHHAHRPAASEAPARPAMWKVADADTTIYLFGTIHALPKGVSWFNGPVTSAFDHSQELVTEIVETDPAQMQTSVVSRAMLPPEKSLRDMLTPDQRKDYEAALKSFDLPEASFDRLKPWYVAVYLSALPMLRDGFDPENGVEKALDARAKAKGRPHTALETSEYQLGLFDSLPEATQIRYLAEVVKTLPKAKNEMASMITAWRTGDAESLARLMNEDQDEPELTERLLTNRNKAWAEWIRKRLDQPGTVFLAVGAGHLAGTGSVQDQLAGKGITSTRVQ